MANIPTNCEICQAPLRRIPAGVSKRTGRPYQEFWACENPDCKYTWRPTKRGTTARPQAESDQGVEILKKLDGLHKMLLAIEQNNITRSKKIIDFFIKK